ncbi:sensor histidine kinase [Fulvivirga lutea]|uniref:histidine kinase n=1 Tax=Fulvivirga lutea TaxID=2810512 RepID=A0A974WE26_9BACT|nr:ATP-binding protein [Fulvivirga lutea]QSE96569.1 GHKL domain-containing protein [Fulvivirga lutea]
MFISILLFSGFYVLTQTYFWLVSIWLFLGALIMLVSLIHTIERHQRDLTNFLIGISQNDFSIYYKGKGKNKLDREMQAAFSIISDKMLELRKISEANYHFLKAVVEHSSIAMLGYVENTGEITLLNNAAKQIFGSQFIKNIKQLNSIDSHLFETIKGLESGDRSLLKLQHDNELVNLSISAKELKLNDEMYKLVSLQNINAELDEKELESWQKLIRVLTHEIKNSVIPISTLTEVINQLILDSNGNLKELASLDEEDSEDVKQGLKTVEKRSKGLVKFVNSYSEFAKIPEPNLEKVSIKVLFDDVTSLLKESFQKNKVELDIQSTPAELLIDHELIEQVLINLLKNALEAVKDIPDATVTMQNYITADGRNSITITDNGPGIDQNTLENIFVPFFTTKKEGSGIGLSLSKQIMRAHKGSIKLVPLETGTRATLEF